MNLKPLATLAATGGAALLLAACSAPSAQMSADQAAAGEPAGQAPALAGRTFVLPGAIPGDAKRPELVFTAEGRLAGTAGCNRILGGWQLDGKKISFGNVGSTMMMCSPEAMKLEQTVIGLLGEAAFATESPEGLTLWDKDGKALATFAPKTN